jgi:ribosome-associated protein
VLPPASPDSLTWRFTRAGGPGGQHVNKTATRVELDCDLRLAGFPAPVTERLVARLGPVVRVVAADTRSQRRNREIAEQRLHEQLAAAAVVPRRRRPTRPTAGATERRLADKRRRGERKASRAALPDD